MLGCVEDIDPTSHSLGPLSCHSPLKECLWWCIVLLEEICLLELSHVMISSIYNALYRLSQNNVVVAGSYTAEMMSQLLGRRTFGRKRFSETISGMPVYIVHIISLNSPPLRVAVS